MNVYVNTKDKYEPLKNSKTIISKHCYMWLNSRYFIVAKGVLDLPRIKFVLNIRTAYRNSVLMNGDKNFFLAEPITHKADTLYELCSAVTFDFIQSHLKGPLLNFLHNTEIIPLGAKLIDGEFYVFTQLVLNKNYDLNTFSDKYWECYIEELPKTIDDEEQTNNTLYEGVFEILNIVKR